MISVKKLLYKICENIDPNKSKIFAATRYSGATDGTFVGFYDAISKTVFFAHTIRMSSDTSTTTALWTIPAEYRPSTAAEYSAVVFSGSGNTPIAFKGYVNTNGAVTQVATGSCRQVIGFGMYKI